MEQTPATDFNGPCALVIAHPGHELQVYGWAAQARPIVYILTDGSGRLGRSRLDSTTRNLQEIGGERGSIYGHLTDTQLYEAILRQNFELFLSLTDELAQSLLNNQIKCVVGDAIEGYNPSHDLCRVILNAAVQLATRAAGHNIRNFDFILAGRPDSIEESPRHQAICIRLDSAGLGRKLAAARQYRELSNDVNDSLNRWGEQAFQTEYLRAVTSDSGLDLHKPPFYEEYGDRQVSKGYYDQVLRYREHFLPVADAIRRHSEKV